MGVIVFILIASAASGWALSLHARERPDLAVILFSCGWFFAIAAGWLVDTLIA